MNGPTLRDAVAAVDTAAVGKAMRALMAELWLICRSITIPVDRRLPLAELRRHLHRTPKQPDWIPYRTSYYSDNWGFYPPQRQLDALLEGDHHAVVDATLADGNLTYAECVIPGASMPPQSHTVGPLPQVPVLHR